MSAALNESNSFQITCVVTKGPHKGQSFTFSKSQITIGRSQDNDIMLINDPMVSRNHCQILVKNGDVEIENLSQKNTLIIEGESVQKWKLLNSSFFLIGDTEITMQIDFGARVVQQNSHSQLDHQPDSDKTNILKAALALVPGDSKADLESAAEKPKLQPLVEKASAIAKQSKPQQSQQSIQNVNSGQMKPYVPQPDFNKSYQQPYAIRDVEVKKDQPIAFYLILFIVLAAAAYLYLEPQKKKTSKPKTSILKYEDEVTLRLNSQSLKDEENDLRKKFDQKNSPMALRAQENFMKGMREFQLGQYARSQEFFQVVLNLHPGHEIATKYLKLARIRFDEVLKAKLMLGENSYQKHNFKMCASQYKQVMNMLEGRNRDAEYRLAESWYKRCQYASQGIK